MLPDPSEGHIILQIVGRASARGILAGCGKLREKCEIGEKGATWTDWVPLVSPVPPVSRVSCGYPNGFSATYLVPESTQNVSFTPATSIWSPSFRSCCPTTSVPLTSRDFAP